MFIIGSCISGFCTPLCIWMFALLNMVEQYPYRYRLPDGWSEGAIGFLAVLFLIGAMIGIILMIFGWATRKNKAKLDTVTNSEQTNFCDHCKLNVADTDGVCPICGNPINRR